MPRKTTVALAAVALAAGLTACSDDSSGDWCEAPADQTGGTQIEVEYDVHHNPVATHYVPIPVPYRPRVTNRPLTPVKPYTPPKPLTPVKPVVPQPKPYTPPKIGSFGGKR
ncbi:hypothetical protein [Microbispora sp. NPDC049633]|uniref:hypothetical protein n=1 Tax=Microbispora sp. NPDC049633 TaxID=3154355 RepID=UPI00342FD650